MIRVAIVGAGFAADLHAQALTATGRARVCGVTSARAESRADFARRWSCTGYVSIAEMLDRETPDAVTLAMPNAHHLAATREAAARGIHVICEKPLARTLAEAEEMVSLCEDAGVHLLYAEQLCFAPRYRRVKELIDAGALGRIIQINHWERHNGPHARWFYDPALSGGGVTLDMGCHGIELMRWLLNKPAVSTVSAHIGTYLHTDEVVDDHSVVTLTFADGTRGIADSSWAAPGGIDERLEVLGTGGVLKADLARGQSMLVYSESTTSFATEKADHTQGWSWVSHDDAWTWGWRGEFEHFVDVLAGTTSPQETGRDGVEVLRLVSAAYASAAEGALITMPYDPGDEAPVTIWLERNRR